MVGHPDQRMALAHPEVLSELKEVFCEPVIDTGGYEAGEKFAFRLVNYRMDEVYCSQGQNLRAVQRRAPYNPLLMNPQDMQTLGTKDGDQVVVDSGFGRLKAIARASQDVPVGVIAMAYGWGDPGGPADSIQNGSNLQAIIPDDYRYDPVSGIALQTAVPVNVAAVRC
jgi:anaerobic selenocysteine-containing dehydrogenase